MTPNQRVFADEYIKTRNATQAYMTAYPKVKNAHTAQVNGDRMLLNAVVREYIDDHLNAMHDSTIADAAEIMRYYTSVIRGEIMDESVTNAGEVVQSKVHTNSRNTAAKQLAKMLGIEDQIARLRYELDKQKTEQDADADDVVVIKL